MSRMKIMRITRRLLCALLLLGVVTYASCGNSSAYGDSCAGVSEAFSCNAPLVIPNADWLLGYEQIQAVTELRRVNPEAVAARGVSSWRYEGLSTGRAAALARSSFPELVTHADGGPQRLTSGERVMRPVSTYAAAIEARDGKHTVVESSEPMYAKASSRLVPIDLNLQHGHGVFRPIQPATGVHVRIPDRLSEGPALGDLGVSLTPVDRQGVALPSSSGVIDGATVFYGHSESSSSGIHDMDTLVKPETLGFAEETLLRSEHSPQVLFFKVNLPDGAHLRHINHSNEVQVVDTGQIIAKIAAPTAVDAEGTSVPLSFGVSAHTHSYWE